MTLYNARFGLYQVDGLIYNPDGSRHTDADSMCLLWEPIILLPQPVVMATVQRRFNLK